MGLGVRKQIIDINQLVEGEGLDSVLNQLVDQDGEGGVVRLSRAVGNLEYNKIKDWIFICYGTGVVLRVGPKL